MRVQKKKPVLVNPAAPENGKYRQGPIYTNGALEFVFERLTTWPLQPPIIRGPGIFTLEHIHPYQPAQAHVLLAVPTSPIVGAGVPAGSIELQGLTDEDFNSEDMQP